MLGRHSVARYGRYHSRGLGISLKLQQIHLLLVAIKQFRLPKGYESFHYIHDRKFAPLL